MEVQQRRRCKQMQWWRVGERLMSPQCLDLTNWRSLVAPKQLLPTSNRVISFNQVVSRRLTDKFLFLEMQQQNAQYRSFSLTGPGAAQLSQSVKERFGSGTHSLPKGSMDMHIFQQRMANRNSGKMLDGSMSDTQTYVDVKPEFGSYSMWLKHSSTTASRLSEGDSLETVSIVSSPGLSRNSKLIQSRESTPVAQQQQQAGANSRLNRSNSIR